MDVSPHRVDGHPREELVSVGAVGVHAACRRPGFSCVVRVGHPNVRVAVAGVGPVDVDAAPVGTVAGVHTRDRHAVDPSNAGNGLVPAPDDVRHDAVLAPSLASVQALVEVNPWAKGPCHKNFSIHADRWDCAFGRVVAVDAVSRLVAHANRLRPLLAFGVGETAQNGRAVAWLFASVSVKLRPARVDVLARGVHHRPFLVLILGGRVAHATAFGPRLASVLGTLTHDPVQQRVAAPSQAFRIAQVQEIKIARRTGDHTRIAKHAERRGEFVAFPRLTAIL